MATQRASIEVGQPIRSVLDQWTQFAGTLKYMEGAGELQREDQSTLPDITDHEPARRIRWESMSGDRKGGVVQFTPVGEDRTCIELEVDFGPDDVADDGAQYLATDGQHIETDLQSFRDFIENGPDNSGEIGVLSASTPGGMPLDSSDGQDSESCEADSSDNNHRGVLSASTPGGMPLTDDEADRDS